MTSRQLEELAKLYLDLGKLVFASLVLGFFQSSLTPQIVLIYGMIGLFFSAGFFIMGMKLIGEIKNG